MSPSDGSADRGARLIVALDLDTPEAALALADRLDPATCRVKIGKALFTRAGPALIEGLHARGFEVFLDLKFHDIPNTMAAACTAAADLGVWMINVHALAGRAAMSAAREALERAVHRPRLIAVTVLTSLDATELQALGFSMSPAEGVERLARLAHESGLDGVVCSPQEAARLRAAHGQGFLLVTPGVRPAGSDIGDQRRTLTPAEAIAAGADYLVVGRPVLEAPDPAAAVAALAGELG